MDVDDDDDDDDHDDDDHDHDVYYLEGFLLVRFASEIQT